MTESADIGYRIFYIDDSGRENDVLPFQRVDSHLMMEEGAILCNHQGSCNPFI